MNSAAHVLIGIFVFLGYSHWISSTTGSSSVPLGYGMIVVIIGSVIPDFIEPATSWRHRGLFHSVGALKTIIVLFVFTGLLAFAIAFFSDFTAVFLLSCFFLGYLFHLLADSITPMGLPY